LSDGTQVLRASNSTLLYDPLQNQWTKLADVPVNATHTQATTDGTYVYMVRSTATLSVADKIMTNVLAAARSREVSPATGPARCW
jgi:hypothetical protein